MRRDVNLGDRDVTIIGTAHVSQESKQEVADAIQDVEPDLLCVELDESRFEALRNESGWRDVNVVEAVRDGKGYMLLMNLLLSIYQRRIGMEEGMTPGDEMLEAVERAEENGVRYELVDRDINETFRRLRDQLSLWEKLKLTASLFESPPDVEVDDLKEENIIDAVVEELEKEFPSISRVFLEERNSYMAERILEEDFEHAVVVVGAAHVEGLVEQLAEPSPVEERAGGGFPWLKALHYGLPVAIVAMLAYSFYQIGFATGFQATKFWVLSNGILAMLGAVIARSHPLTWAISFISAPLTSLDPALGAGMVAGYAEGKFYPPTVGELEDIAHLDSYRELWDNQVGRILLTLFFVTIGSAIATFLGAGYIAALISAAV
ncbi:MAG: TraB/GumN family protein [Candidatus Nanohaloarchaea archaeon]